MNYIEFNIKIKKDVDYDIDSALKEAITVANRIRESIDLDMGKFSLRIHPYSYIEDIKDKYYLKIGIFNDDGNWDYGDSYEI